MAQINGDNNNNNLPGTIDNDIINGGGGNDQMFGNGGTLDLLFGDEGDDFMGVADGGDHLLDGGSGNDQLFGANGNDALDGGRDNDFMQGGSGNDTYIVDIHDIVDGLFGDRVLEFANQGNDTVKSSVSFRLPDNVENLTLTGTSNINGIGNASDNSIIGNAGINQLFGGGGNDILNGATGNDFMQGGAGNDTYIVDSSGDILDELTFPGDDAVLSSITFTLPVAASIESLTLTGTTDINGTGNNLSNTILGNAGNNLLAGLNGNDSLIGGSGFDKLTGGAGNDSFDGGNGIGLDQVVEAGNVNFTLTNTTLTGNGTDTLTGIEGAELTGGSGNNTFDTTKFDLGGVTLFGGAGDDTLKTGKGNDTIRGDAGNDTMQGGDGIDTYFVDSSNDKVIETSATGGNDFVNASASFTLGANVENLTLIGAGGSNINGTGNGLDNTIKGDANNNTLKGKDGKDILTGRGGNDILVGGTGTDSLTGNSGDDRFTFDTGAAFNNTTVGLDTITDFINFGLDNDQIVLDKTTFTALKSVTGDGFSVASEFAVVVSSSAAATSSALITYNSGTGQLFFNQNGAADGLGTGGQFASVSGHPGLGTADFVIQA